MASKSAKSSDVKVRKKRWVQIVSPEFNDSVIAETPVYELKDALDRSLKINLMSLNGDPRKQSTHILFKTSQQKGESAVIAELQGYEVQQPILKKMVRRGKTKVNASFKCYTGDKKPIVIKPFIITRFRVNNQVAAKIRGHVVRKIVNKVAEMSFRDFLDQVVTGKMQKEIQQTAGKTYPIRTLELYTVKIVSPDSGKFLLPGDEGTVEEEVTDDDDEDYTDEDTEDSSSDSENDSETDSKADSEVKETAESADADTEESSEKK